MADPTRIDESAIDADPRSLPRLDVLKSRLPVFRELFPVFSVFIFSGFSWGLYRIFWYVPSWLKYLSVSKIWIIAAYVATFALLESMFMTVLLVLFSLFFPARYFKDQFALQGASLAGLLSLSAYLLQRKINLVYRLELWQLAFFSFLLLTGLVLSVFLFYLLYTRVPVLARFVGGLAERITIFSYIYIPLGVFGLLVVVLRNLFGMR